MRHLSGEFFALWTILFVCIDHLVKIDTKLHIEAGGFQATFPEA
jgi:hypothetical protein